MRDENAEHLGRLERRAEALRERIAARGEGSTTSSEDAELSSVEAAIAALDAMRWRRSIDESIPREVTRILAAVVDEEGVTFLLSRDGDAWQCTCGCARNIGYDRIHRWRPVISAVASRLDDSKNPLVSSGSYRGRRRLAIIDDRIRFLTARAAELKAKGASARFEKYELESLTWIRDLALRDNATAPKTSQGRREEKP